MPRERWVYVTDKSVPGIDKDRYMVSEFGRFWDSTTNYFPVITIDDEGYSRVHVFAIYGFKTVYLHRLIKIEFDGFDPDPNKNQVDHVNCDKTCNYLNNLEWVTKEENALRAINNNLYYQFDIVIDDEDAKTICIMLKNGNSYKEINDYFQPKYNRDLVGIIGKIYRGERWKHISKDFIPFPKLKKEKVVPSNSVLNENIVREICVQLENGIGISKTAKYIFKINLALIKILKMP